MMEDRQLVVSACTRPFSNERREIQLPAGLTLAQMVEIAQPDEGLRGFECVFIGSMMIPRERWHVVRPKPGVVVVIKVVPGGGGVGRILAFAALAAAVIAIAVFAPPLVGALLGPAVAIGGSLLINTLLPAPVPKISQGVGTTSQTYAIAGSRNSANVWGKVPFVMGLFRFTPPFAALPYREVLGGQVYWRAMFCIGHGPVQIQEIRIGSTDVAQFEGVEYEIRRGYWSFTVKGGWNASSGSFPSSPTFGDQWTVTTAGTVDGRAYTVGETITFNGITASTSQWAWDIDQEKQFRLFGMDVYEDQEATDVLNGAPVIRTSQPDADVLNVELIFDRGLAFLENSPPGKLAPLGVAVRIEQSPTGAANWTTVVETPIWGKQTEPLFWGWRWETKNYGAQDANKQYDIRVTRLTENFNEERKYGNFTWYAVRTETLRAPVPPIPGLCFLAMRVRASGQLQGTLDEVNCICWSQARDYDAGTGSWVWRVTSQPAALFRHMLQHPTRRIPAADGDINLAKLQYWDGLNRANMREFNGVFDAKTSLWSALTDVARVGRAVPALPDLKWSVIIDEPKTTPIRMFTPRNSINYSCEFTHDRTPHAYRISFVDASSDYVADETIVYDDGRNASNATVIDRVDWVGITSQPQAWREGRFHLAQQRLRREVHRVTTDLEYLACDRGDLVALQYDAISVGMGAARVAAIATSGGNVTSVTFDQAFTLATGTTYGFRARRVVSGAQTTTLYQVVTPGDGQYATLSLASPPLIANGPAVGDLISFGQYDTETLRVIIRDIIPNPTDGTAELVMISEAPGVHVAESGAIPAWDPRVTLSTLPAPRVISIRSDAAVMLVTASRALITRVVFTIAPSPIEGATHTIEYRITGTSAQWAQAQIQEESPTVLKVVGVEQGTTYDFRIVRRHRDYLTAPATQVNGYLVVGRTAPPEGLQNMTIAAIGGQALLRWDLPGDLDVQIGGWIMFRYSPLLTGATWPNSTSIGRAVAGDQTQVYLPLMEGSYLARVYDADGLESLTTAIVTTKQASVLGFITEGTVQEDPSFLGVKTQCEVVSSTLQLTAGDFDSVPDVDNLPDWDLAGAYVVGSGTYKFAGGFDFGTVKNIRLTTILQMVAVNLVDEVDGDDLWDSQEDVDGTSNAPVDAAVYIKVTDDDPSGSPTWSNFIRLDVADVRCRGVGQIECRMTTTSPVFNIRISQLRIRAERL